MKTKQIIEYELAMDMAVVGSRTLTIDVESR